MTLRGGNLEPHQLEKYQPGQIVTESAFTSTSATAGFNGNTFFVCRSEHGKDVSELSENVAQDGVEILFPPGTHFKVLSREELFREGADKNTIIVMTEVS